MKYYKWEFLSRVLLDSRKTHLFLLLITINEVIFIDIIVEHHKKHFHWKRFLYSPILGKVTCHRENLQKRWKVLDLSGWVDFRGKRHIKNSLKHQKNKIFIWNFFYIPPFLEKWLVTGKIFRKRCKLLDFKKGGVKNP